ncbi:MAG TPA: hypothetical protein VNI54_09285 [Thermoanaerobaculia bacterium]|nr:hypothetical protein [Thermoanaerobaculia bacterium]
MRRATVRFIALFVLALLGAPVAMHVVLHDLYDHHAEHTNAAMIGSGDHGDHEHPIVGSPAPQIPSTTRAALPILVQPGGAPAMLRRVAITERNVLSLGALRVDDDVGLQPLLSTFLI